MVSFRIAGLAIVSFFAVFISGQTPAPIAYYPLDSNANDYSGHGYNAALNGSTQTSDRFGRTNHAYRTGATSIRATNFAMPDSPAISVSAWIRPDSGFNSFADANGYGIVEHNFGPFELFIGQDKKIHVYLFANGHQGGYDDTLSYTFTEGQWYHIAFVSRVNSQTKLFINGTKFTTGANAPSTFESATNTMCIGGGMAGAWLPGAVDDVRIYSVALSDSLVGSLYHENGWPVASDSLVAYYPFSGNANDMSGHNNNGTVHGAILSSDKAGLSNSAYAFDGSSYIDCGNDTSLRPSKFTIAAWAETDTIPICQCPGNCAKVLVCYTPPTWALGAAWKLQLDATTSGQKDSFPSFVMWTSGTGSQNILGSSPIVAKQWYHFAGTYDGTTQNFYVDGVPIGSHAATLSYLGLDRVLIGATKESSSGSLAEFWKGTIDDVRLYNRALSATEITALYNISSAVRRPYRENHSSVSSSAKPICSYVSGKLLFKLPSYSSSTVLRICKVDGKLLQSCQIPANTPVFSLLLGKQSNSSSILIFNIEPSNVFGSISIIR